MTKLARPRSKFLGGPPPVARVILTAFAPAFAFGVVFNVASLKHTPFPGDPAVDAVWAALIAPFVLSLLAARTVVFRSQDIFRLEPEVDDDTATNLESAALRILLRRPDADRLRLRVTRKSLLITVLPSDDVTFVDLFPFHDGKRTRTPKTVRLGTSCPGPEETEEIERILRRSMPRLRMVSRVRPPWMARHLRALRLLALTFLEAFRDGADGTTDQRAPAAMNTVEENIEITFARPTAHQVARLAAAPTPT